MMTTGVDSINSTVQQTHEWLMELCDMEGMVGEAQAYTALRAVLQTLRDRLTVDEAAHLAAQLPMLIRGVYYEGWKPARSPGRMRTRQEFFGAIADRLGNSELDPVRACRSVFHLLERKISPGEIRDVVRMLPEEVRELWTGQMT